MHVLVYAELTEASTTQLARPVQARMDPFVLWRNPHVAGLQTSREASDYKLQHIRKRASRGYKRPKASSYEDYRRYRKLFWPDRLNPDRFKKETIFATHINDKGRPVFPQKERVQVNRPSSPWNSPPSPRPPLDNKASRLREELWIRNRKVINTNIHGETSQQRGVAEMKARPQTTMPRPRKSNLTTTQKSYKDVLQREIRPFTPSFRIMNEEVVPGALTGNSTLHMVANKKQSGAQDTCSSSIPVSGSDWRKETFGKVTIPKLWVDKRFPLHVRHTRSSLLMKQRFSPRNCAGTTLRLGLSPRHHTQPSRKFTNW